MKSENDDANVVNFIQRLNLLTLLKYRPGIELQNLLNVTIQHAKREHTRLIVDELNSLDGSGAGWWKVVRTVFGSPRETIPALESRGHHGTFFVNDAEGNANPLDDFFVSITHIRDESCNFPCATSENGCSTPVY